MWKSGIKNYIIASVFVILLGRCEADRCLHSAGKKIKVRVETGDFKQIEIMNMFHVILVQDTVEFVEIEAGENEIEYIHAENTDGILFLDDENKCFWLRDYELIRVYVHIDDIDNLNIQEVSLLTSHVPITDHFQIGVQARLAEADLEYDSEVVAFYTNKTTGGRYKFKGHSERCFLYSTYSSVIQADSLITQHADIYNHSIGNISIHVTNSLHVEITNSGNVYYSGEVTDIEQEISSTGKLIHTGN